MQWDHSGGFCFFYLNYLKEIIFFGHPVLLANAKHMILRPFCLPIARIWGCQVWQYPPVISSITYTYITKPLKFLHNRLKLSHDFTFTESMNDKVMVDAFSHPFRHCIVPLCLQFQILVASGSSAFPCSSKLSMEIEWPMWISAFLSTCRKHTWGSGRASPCYIFFLHIYCRYYKY